MCECGGRWASAPTILILWSSIGNGGHIVGRKAKFDTQAMPASPPPYALRVIPADMLDITDKEFVGGTHLQVLSLTEHKNAYVQMMLDPTYRGRHGFVEVGRGPTGRTVWSTSVPVTDRCQCLRA